MISKNLQCVNTCNDVQSTNYDEFSFLLTAKVSGFDIYNSDFSLKCYCLKRSHYRVQIIYHMSIRNIHVHFLHCTVGQVT